MFKWIKNEWNKKGCFYRTVRTFFQAAVSVLLTGLTALVTQEIGFEWNAIYNGILVPAFSAGLGAVMNISKTKDDENNE